MLRLSRKLMFAVEAVVDIAYHSGEGLVQSAEITRRQGIPRRYLEQVLQHLVRGDILTGVRGPRGGYRLARERRRISMGDILRVVREIEQSGEDDGTDTGSELARQVVRPIWTSLEEECMARLDKVSVEDLCSKAREAGITGENQLPPDFVI